MPTDYALTSHPLAVVVYDHRVIAGFAPPPRRYAETMRRMGDRASYIAALRRIEGVTVDRDEAGAFHLRPSLSLAS